MLEEIEDSAYRNKKESGPWKRIQGPEIVYEVKMITSR